MAFFESVLKENCRPSGSCGHASGEMYVRAFPCFVCGDCTGSGLFVVLGESCIVFIDAGSILNDWPAHRSCHSIDHIDPEDPPQFQIN